jgi:hypothetical protein
MVDPAEFISLRAIVMALVALAAAQNEKLSGLPAQTYINNMAGFCADAIRNAKISGPDPERIRGETLYHVNNILGGVSFRRRTSSAFLAANSSGDTMPFCCKSASRSIFANISISWAVSARLGSGFGGDDLWRRNSGRRRVRHPRTR